VIESRYYKVNGIRVEARFFRKGEMFPATDLSVPKQGIWLRRAHDTWDCPVFGGASWRFVNLDADVLYFPEKK
jgi:hypothetical protein